MNPSTAAVIGGDVASKENQISTYQFTVGSLRLPSQEISSTNATTRVDDVSPMQKSPHCYPSSVRIYEHSAATITTELSQKKKKETWTEHATATITSRSRDEHVTSTTAHDFNDHGKSLNEQQQEQNVVEDLGNFYSPHTATHLKKNIVQSQIAAVVMTSSLGLASIVINPFDDTDACTSTTRV
ncbi:hypothetical protein ACH5RR_021187 [Cinchona calisaya]|uniref:Uncharacterized protein n=1 Tax=Cinchona calisaya TaxID=153742 RepID=A0ABD2ZLK1_9GENT